VTTDRVLAVAGLLCGLAVVALSFVFVSMNLRSLEPLAGAYGDQAILAFELAQTPEQLAAVIGSNPPTEEAVAIRRALDRANHLDFAYLALYGAFIALACACAARRRAYGWVLLGAPLGLLAALFDAAENLVMLRLTESHADVAALLPSLHWRTLAKWELLAVTSALFAAAFMVAGRAWQRAAAGLVALLALAGGVLTLVDAPRFLALLSGVIALVWLWQLGYCASVLRRSRSV
jgi:hypothetical protein